MVELTAGIALIALVAYALLGGADFGGGVWDLLARGPRAAAQRDLIARAIGPIWEANHVWLILVVVVLFTAFPPAFAHVMTWLHVPVTLMLVGIVLRGSSFVFRAYDAREDRVQRRWGRIFAISSVVTPVLLGVVIGTISMPVLRGTPNGAADFFTPWLHPFPWAVGLFALAQFALLAAVYLTVDADDAALRNDFRRRALGTAAVVGALAWAVILLAGDAAPALRARLLGADWALPLHATTAACALGAIGALWKRAYALARVLAAAQVALVLIGWGLAMSPWLVMQSVSIHDAAAPASTLRLLLLALAAGSLLLFPALYYLFRTFKGGVLLPRD